MTGSRRCATVDVPEFLPDGGVYDPMFPIYPADTIKVAGANIEPEPGALHLEHRFGVTLALDACRKTVVLPTWRLGAPLA